MNTAFQSITRLARPLLTKPAPRTFTTLAPLRPTLSAPLRRTTFSPFAPTMPSATGVADVVPSGSISAHPAFADMQIRCGPRNTMNGHTRLVQKRRHGFLSRMKSKTGRRILQRRREKGRRRVGC